MNGIESMELTKCDHVEHEAPSKTDREARKRYETHQHRSETKADAADRSDDWGTFPRCDRGRDLVKRDEIRNEQRGQEGDKQDETGDCSRLKEIKPFKHGS